MTTLFQLIAAASGERHRWTNELVSCPRKLWTKRRAGRGAPPRNTLSRNPHRALVRSHESEATASGNAQKPRFHAGAPRPARRPRVNGFLGHYTRLHETLLQAATADHHHDPAD